MNLSEYEKSGCLLYRLMADTVATILAASIKAHGTLRLQQIQSRAKDPDSLRNKLSKLSLLKTQSLAAEVKDLAGCRIIFYTNSDVRKYLDSGIIQKDFDIDWDRSKIHYPIAKDNLENSLFISCNYVVKIKENRVSLPEYANLKGLWCEIQIQTILNHAWAEMAHDTIYKRPDVNRFGKRKLEEIEMRMNNIMRQYLMPAGYEFQKVVYDAELLADGREIFDRGALEELSGAADNNARFDALKRFVDYVLPNYNDPVAVYPEIRVGMIKAVKAARATPPISIQTVFGEIDGHTSDQIESLAARVLESLRYANVIETFNATCELYLGAGDLKGRKLWADVAINLAKNELQAWNQVGPGVQYELVLCIERFTPQEREALRGLLLPVLREVLSPDVKGISSTWDAITLYQGAVAASETLRKTRAKALEILKIMFQSASDVVMRQSVVDVFMQATRAPYNDNYSDDLIKIILENSLSVIGYFVFIINQMPFELRQRIECDLHALYVSYRNITQEMENKFGPYIDAVNAAILVFKDRVNIDNKFFIYKTLMWHKSVFKEDWESADLCYRYNEKMRNIDVEKIVDIIEEENAESWLLFLKQCAQVQPRDRAALSGLMHFLQTLGARKPRIIIGYLNALDDNLVFFLPCMLFGLSKGPGADEGVRLVQAWLRERKHVVAIMHYLSLASPVNPELLDEAMAAAIETKDDAALLRAVYVAGQLHGDVVDGLIARMLVPAIEQLSLQGKSLWVDVMCSYIRRGTLISDLTGDQADIILAIMVQHPRIESHPQAVLAALGVRWPEKVIDFFEQRLKHPENSDPNYEAVPIQFFGERPLNDTSVAALIDRAYGWYRADKRLFRYRGGRLIAGLFPKVSDALADVLITFVDGGCPERVNYVLEIMGAYHGESFLQPVCREVIARLPDNDPLLGKVENILSATSVVSGDFGFVEAYQQKKREIEPWLADPHCVVRAFACRYQRTLDQRIAGEQHRAEERSELRRRNWDTPEGNADES